MKKPADCTCQFPDVIARNPTGHGAGCPAGTRRWSEIMQVAEGSYPPPIDIPIPTRPEDRGTTVYIWEDRRFPGVARFSPEPDTRRFTISAPIGWQLRTDPEFGVVLARPTRGPEAWMGAGVALLMAREGRDGFRIRERPPV